MGSARITHGKRSGAYARASNNQKGGRTLLAAGQSRGSPYRAARVSPTGRAVRTGKAGRRARNVTVGHGLAKAGFWSRLWR